MTQSIPYDAVPTDPLKRRGWVVWQLKMRGGSLRQLARRVGLTQQSLSYGLVAPHGRAERAIADALDLTVQDLFPERYDPATGERLHHERPLKPSKKVVQSPATAEAA